MDLKNEGQFREHLYELLVGDPVDRAKEVGCICVYPEKIYKTWTCYYAGRSRR